MFFFFFFFRPCPNLGQWQFFVWRINRNYVKTDWRTKLSSALFQPLLGVTSTSKDCWVRWLGKRRYGPAQEMCEGGKARYNNRRLSNTRKTKNKFVNKWGGRDATINSQRLIIEILSQKGWGILVVPTEASIRVNLLLRWLSDHPCRYSTRHVGPPHNLTNPLIISPGQLSSDKFHSSLSLESSLFS